MALRVYAFSDDDMQVVFTSSLSSAYPRLYNLSYFRYIQAMKVKTVAFDMAIVLAQNQVTRLTVEASLVCSMLLRNVRKFLCTSTIPTRVRSF